MRAHRRVPANDEWGREGEDVRGKGGRREEWKKKDVRLMNVFVLPRGKRRGLLKQSTMIQSLEGGGVVDMENGTQYY